MAILPTKQLSAESPHRFCVIIGAMKSGTTKLFRDLRGHPQVCASNAKETNFFIDLMRSGDWEKIPESEILACYQGCWPDYDSAVHCLALEASPNYSKYPFKPPVAEAMAKLTSSTDASFKLIYILRNPLEAIASFYRHSFTEPGLAWAEQHRRAILDHGILSANPLAIYSYARQLDLFSACIPRESILLICFEDLAKAPAKVHDKLSHFLGLSTDFKIPDCGIVHSSLERLQVWRDQSVDLSSEDYQAWNLSDMHRAAIVHILGDDVRRLREFYEFDISAWPEFC